MAEQKKVTLTQASYDKLVAEKNELETVKKKEIAEHIKEAKGYGDLSENAEYDAAKEEQAQNQARIQEINDTLANSVIIKEEDIREDIISIGVTVTVKDKKTKKNVKYDIVATNEVDPFSDPAKISTDSAIGDALVGRTTGDKVEITVPDGVLNYEIVKIEITN